MDTPATPPLGIGFSQAPLRIVAAPHRARLEGTGIGARVGCGLLTLADQGAMAGERGGPGVRIVRPGHRVTGDSRDSVEGAGWEYANVAIDDCSRYTYVEILPDEKRYTATAFWLRAVREFQQRGIKVQRVLTDNGGAYRKFDSMTGRQPPSSPVYTFWRFAHCTS